MNYLYRITNTINNKIYIGVHKTDDINDGYMGSGSVIKSSIKKYSIENFKKDILEFFDTYELALAEEAKIVTDDFLLREDVYNLRRGGAGGFDYINKLKTDTERTRIGRLGQQAIREKKVNKYSDNYVSRFSDKKLQAELLSRAMTPAAIEKRKETYKLIKHSQGESNSQFGTCWVHCEFINKSIKIKKELIPYYLDQGWSKGRKIMG